MSVDVTGKGVKLYSVLPLKIDGQHHKLFLARIFVSLMQLGEYYSNGYY